jgi:hypothetical protein
MGRFAVSSANNIWGSSTANEKSEGRPCGRPSDFSPAEAPVPKPNGQGGELESTLESG